MFIFKRKFTLFLGLALLIPLNEICSQNLLTEEAIGFQEGEFTRNGVGNVKGNRSRVDMLEKRKDGTYAAYEIKLSSKSKPSKGQKAVEEHAIKGNQTFEVRSQKKGFNRGDEIKISDYRYIYK